MQHNPRRNSLKYKSGQKYVELSSPDFTNPQGGRDDQPCDRAGDASQSVYCAVDDPDNVRCGEQGGPDSIEAEKNQAKTVARFSETGGV